MHGRSSNLLPIIDFSLVIGIFSRRSRRVASAVKADPLFGLTPCPKTVIRRLFCFGVKRKLVPDCPRSARSWRCPMSKFVCRPDPLFRSVAADRLLSSPPGRPRREIGRPQCSVHCSPAWRDARPAKTTTWSEQASIHRPSPTPSHFNFQCSVRQDPVPGSSHIERCSNACGGFRTK